MPTVACDFLSRERERESGVGGDEFLLLGVVDAHFTWESPAKQPEKKKKIMIIKDRKAMCCESEKKEQESEMGNRIKVLPIHSYIKMILLKVFILLELNKIVVISLDKKVYTLIL